MNKRLLSCIEIYASVMALLSSGYMIYFFYINTFKTERRNEFICDGDLLEINKSNIETMIINQNYTASIEVTNGFIIADETYYAVDKEYIERILVKDTVNSFKYEKEIFDCDEFGIVLLANNMILSKMCEYLYRIAFGILIGVDSETGENHLLNFFIDSKSVFWCVEPQTDEIFLCDNGKYMFDLLII